MRRVVALCLVALGAPGCFVFEPSLAGDFGPAPEDLRADLSPAASRLVDESLAGLAPDELVDCHIHLISMDVHPSWMSWWHPFKRTRSRFYLAAAGVEESEAVADEHLERLVGLIRSVPGCGRFFVYAMDRHHDRDGTPNADLTSFYVSNEQAFGSAERFPDCLVPVISVHPYRTDALEELDRWAAEGCRFVKWIPSAQGIDPSDPLVEPFYRRMIEHDLVLLTHTGEEQAVDADEMQRFGNPLLLRTPLDMGVKVVALHAASLGEEADLDDPDRAEVPSFDLFMRLMDDPRYEGLLFGEIAALTFWNRDERPLKTLLDRQDLHHRLLNGSDYPLPGMNILVHTSQFASAGYITEEQCELLNEIYALNPLFFDFALKRALRDPETGAKFADSVFELPPELAVPERWSVR